MTRHFLRDDDLSPAEQGAVLDLDAEVSAAVVEAAMANGVILNACTPDRIRIVPPLVLTADQAQEFLDVWPTILDEAYAAQGSR